MSQRYGVSPWSNPDEEETQRHPPPSDERSKSFWLEVFLPFACVLINVPSICGSRLFALDGDLAAFRFLILACGFLGCAARAISLIDRAPTPRRLGWMAGALLIAICGSAVGLLIILPRMLDLLGAVVLIFPIPLLLMGIFPYIGVVRWCMALSKCAKLLGDQAYKRAFAQAAVASAALLIGLHCLFATLVGHAKQTLAQGDSGAAPAAIVLLQAVPWERDQSAAFVQQAWYGSAEPARKQALGDAYRSLTGKQIEASASGSGCW